MSLIDNERTKLTAAWLNAISAAAVAVGGFAQLAPLVSGTASTSFTTVAVFGLAWFGFGLVLHLAALWFLGRLKE